MCIHRWENKPCTLRLPSRLRAVALLGQAGGGGRLAQWHQSCRAGTQCVDPCTLLWPTCQHSYSSTGQTGQGHSGGTTG